MFKTYSWVVVHLHLQYRRRGHDRREEVMLEWELEDEVANIKGLFCVKHQVRFVSKYLRIVLLSFSSLREERFILGSWFQRSQSISESVVNSIMAATACHGAKSLSSWCSGNRKRTPVLADFLLFLFRLDLQPMGRCHTHSEWVFHPDFIFCGDTLTDTLSGVPY
jgi:hypothetical protein